MAAFQNCLLVVLLGFLPFLQNGVAEVIELEQINNPCNPGENATFVCSINSNESFDSIYFEINSRSALNFCNLSCEVCCDSNKSIHTLKVRCEHSTVREVNCVARNSATNVVEKSTTVTITYGPEGKENNTWHPLLNL